MTKFAEEFDIEELGDIIKPIVDAIKDNNVDALAQSMSELVELIKNKEDKEISIDFSPIENSIREMLSSQASVNQDIVNSIKSSLSEIKVEVSNQQDNSLQDILVGINNSLKVLAEQKQQPIKIEKDLNNYEEKIKFVFVRQKLDGTNGYPVVVSAEATKTVTKID